MKIDCGQCHNPAGWNIDYETLKFDHKTTGFALEGTHARTDCKQCHSSLVFSDAPPANCASCHTDVHSMTVGDDCARCHNATSWLVANIPEIHEENGFPLIGAHGSLSCVECHNTSANLRFDRIGNDCINCHREDFMNTQNPNHQRAGFSTNCLECHNPLGHGWGTDAIAHDFFPLTQGHDIQDCNRCHTTGNFEDASPECVSCHLNDFQATRSPNHNALGFSTDCASCHTTAPGWNPANFVDHDAEFFPIYSGDHQGVWNDCVDCHTNPNNYAEYSCTNCHTNPETNHEHNGVSGYVYEDRACLACHPTGDADNTFDHSSTDFPLTGAHIGVECLECHTNGFQGTPTDCFACHEADYRASRNPNHSALGLSTDCASCHTTDPNWEPARFDVHNDYYALNGAHALIAEDCASCHHGDYNNTPNTCVGCHQTDYNQTTNPDHAASNFPTDCAGCHGESSWTPANFDHDMFYVLNGAHALIADECARCHVNNNYNNTPNTCVGCHQNDYNNTSNPNHASANFPTDCAS
ncbi:MAG: hypothetical protein D6730_02620, partial [Bacteroidetes bacterium]